jgi:hypothetical protein
MGIFILIIFIKNRIINKMTTKKGADPSIILEILMSMDLSNLNSEQLRDEVKEKYSSYFSKTSKDTIKAIIREDLIIENQKRRTLIKLPQDLKKLDIMAVNYNENKDVIEISLCQQKGNNASFNSTSESKTLECMSDCLLNETYKEFFNLLPDNLNPNKCGKKYVVDVCIGMVNACGSKIKIKNNVEIKYYTNNEYLSYLGLDIDIVELAMLIEKNNRIKNHFYDAISECLNWDEIYDKSLNLIKNNGIK